MPMVKMADVGLAKELESSDASAREHTVLGTELYASPEQLLGKYTYSADAWAMGVILYEIWYSKF